MNIEELYSKYVGERHAWVRYREAKLTNIPFTEWEISNYRKDGIDMPDGHTYPGLPKPKNFEEAWEQFVRHDAQMVFEMRAEDFLKKYRGVTVGVLEGELDEINEFIAKAKATVKTSKAFADSNSLYGLKPELYNWAEEYIRLSNGYYNSRFDRLGLGCSHTVYGTYFMFKQWLEEQLASQPGTNNNTQSQEVKKSYALKDMFHNPAHADVYLNILKEIPNPVLDGSNHYIGKGKKGIFPIWIKVLQRHNPSLIKPKSDIEYKEILNATIPNLNLSKDASEFRTTYARIESSSIELDMKTILSQYSQSGKLGK